MKKKVNTAYTNKDKNNEMQNNIATIDTIVE